jgi:hypothetical protein
MTDHALLLVNLGSPASTSVADVRSYLNQFLMDPYVIDLPWPVRRLLVSLILIKRPEQSAHAYASIWWEEGSPLVVLSRRLQQAVTAHWTHGPVELAMRYGEPSIESSLLRLVGGNQANHPGAALSTVRRQHHHHGDRRSQAGGAREETRRATVGAAAVLRSAGIPRCLVASANLICSRTTITCC